MNLKKLFGIKEIIGVIGAELFLFLLGFYYQLKLVNIFIILLIFNIWYINTMTNIIILITKKENIFKIKIIKSVLLIILFLLLSFCTFSSLNLI